MGVGVWRRDACPVARPEHQITDGTNAGMPNRTMKGALVGDLVLEMMALHGDIQAPLHHRIYAALRQSILQNRIPVGTKLPSTRDLAGIVGVGRNTVLRAYEQLVMEGYVQGQTGAGTFVADTLIDVLPRAARPAF